MSAFQEYLLELDSLLKVGDRERVSILEEVHDHLIESAERLSASTLPLSLTEARSISAFGSPSLIAGTFNAVAGGKAMRRVPIINFFSGLIVVVSFLATAINQPQTTLQATISQQVAFFISVIAFQIALIAGVCGLFRALASWSNSESSGSHRAQVRRCAIISLLALVCGVVALTTNFIFDVYRVTDTNRVALTIGSASMFMSAGVGLFYALTLQVNEGDEDRVIQSTQDRNLLSLGASALHLVRRFPVLSCSSVTALSVVWVMAHAESPSFFAAYPWGVAQAIAVVTGFLFLGPKLGLRGDAEPV